MKHASTAFPAKGPSLRVGEGCRGLFVKIPKSQKLSQKYFIQILFNKWKRTFFTSPVGLLFYFELDLKAPPIYLYYKNSRPQRLIVDMSKTDTSSTGSY